MIFYYDTAPVYPYICFSETDSSELEQIIEILKNNNIIVNKFYEKPRYPASNGITYEFLLRINYINPEKRIKPESELISKLLIKFQNQKSNIDNVKTDNVIIENDEKYLKQFRTFLNSERKIIEIDKQFIKEQLLSLNSISKNFKSENAKLSKIIEDYQSNLNNELSILINQKTSENDDFTKIEIALNKKQEILLEKEKELEKKFRDVEKEKNDLIIYKNNLELEKQDFVGEIRNLQLGITNTNEDSIQDLRILVFGDSKLNSPEIFEIFSKAFNSKFGEELTKKSVESRFLSYKEVKNSNVIKKIDSNKFDYLIVGPHDHSIKGKNIKSNFNKYCEQRNLKSTVYESLNISLNKENIELTAKILMDDWDKQFEFEE